jgi:hypothetical protein
VPEHYKVDGDLEEFLDSTLERHRCVQRAIAELANESLGLNDPPSGIGRAEGGVKIRGIAVKIRKGIVYASGEDPRPEEEKAVARAIESVFRIWKENGKILPSRFCKGGWVMVTPLIHLYEPRDVESRPGLPE